ncbi:MAG: xanthine dehydrogenase family protein molybdopterin-binding subunit [Gemmatimonadales bacterium]
MIVPLIGRPLDRVDGRLKVTGGARYSAEMPTHGVVHAVLVQSTIGAGRIASVDTRAAERAPGVLLVMTHLNAPKLPHGNRPPVERPAGRVLTLLQDGTVHYNGQPIAVVVAETLEQATHAATLVQASYQSRRPVVDAAAALGTARTPDPSATFGEDPDSHRGDVEAGLGQADVRLDQTYITPAENHNPMEPHATIAVWEADKLTLYSATQYVSGEAEVVSKTLGLAPEQVRVVCPFVGGGFGCKGSTWSHVLLAAMAAKRVGRPVKLVLSRKQMFGPVGGRPVTIQRVTLGAKRDGTLTAIRHISTSHTSRMEDWSEGAAMVTRMLYACPNVETGNRLVSLDLGTPTFQRAPGEATGTYALEAAMDELAYRLEMDPLELRLKNYAEQDPEQNKPWSSKSLRECYRAAADRFGWSKRTPKPRSMRDGDVLVGYGMATATYPTLRRPASAVARLTRDGRGAIQAVVQAGTQDLGTGTYTVMTQIAADVLGLAPEQVRFELGDTRLPPSPVSGGSMTAASAGSAVHEAARACRQELVRLAVTGPGAPLSGASEADVRTENARLFLASDPAKVETYDALLRRNAGKPIEGWARNLGPGPEKEQYSMHAFGASFAEVHVDAELGQIRVPRVVAAYAAGHMLNAKTARSQLMGGLVWGISMAFLEATLIDSRTGRILNADLAEYHVPVNADVGDIDVIMIDEDDPHVNPIGVKGIGEIGITGIPAALANAVYHATGVRVRELPITLDRLLAPPPGAGA